VPIAGLASDSDYWEIMARVQIPPGDARYNGYGSAYDRAGPQDITLPAAPGMPPFSQSQGSRWSAVSSVASSFGTAFTPGAGETVLTAVKADSRDYQIIPFPNGKIVSYLPAWSIADIQTARAGRAAAIASVAAPYSGPRVPAATAG
jgi:hypothetical protein